MLYDKVKNMSCECVCVCVCVYERVWLPEQVADRGVSAARDPQPATLSPTVSLRSNHGSNIGKSEDGLRL